jgi:NAD(P)-dependent dehydrogenase (short-subunit alcohol dehydrogenase family)
VGHSVEPSECLSGGLERLGAAVIVPLNLSASAVAAASSLGGAPGSLNTDALLEMVRCGIDGVRGAAVVVLPSPLPAPVAASFGETAWWGSAVNSSALGALVRELSVAMAPTGSRINLLHFGPLDPQLCCPDCPWAAPSSAVAAVRAAAMTRRLPGPSEVLGAVEFLIGDASSYVNGITLAVDGGITGVRYQ